MMCAVDFARQGQYAAVVCGHVHYAEDTLHEGIRYINLGAWTESPNYCLLVDEQHVRLMSLDKALEESDWFA